MEYVILVGDGGGNFSAYGLTHDEAQACLNSAPGCAVSLNATKYTDCKSFNTSPTMLVNSGQAVDRWFIIKGDAAKLLPNGYTLQ